MIKAVILDLWGVLTIKKHFLFDEIKADLGLHEAPHHYFIELLERMEIGELDEPGFWQAFCAHIGIAVPKNVRPWTEYYKIITIKNEPLLALASQLKQQGVQLAVLSNVDRAGAEYTTSQGIFDGFDATIFSCDAGLLKPDPRIYKIALEKLHIQPNEAIFVDDRAENVAAAKESGMHGIIFETVDQTKVQLARHTRLALH